MTELLWQRPTVITIAYFVLRQLKQLVSNFSNFIPMLSALLVTGISLQSFLFIALGYVLFVMIGAVLSYRYFAFAVTADALHMRSGVLNRQQLTLKFARIQQAEIKQPWYFRPFKLTIIGVDSAGSSGKEIEIPGLTLIAAQQLRSQLLSGQTAMSDEADTTSLAQQVDYRLQFSLGELLRGGLMDNKVWLLMAVLVYPMSQLNVFEDYVAPWLQQQAVAWSQTPAVTVTIAVVSGVIALFIAGLLVTLVTDYRLTLSIHKGRFQAQAGLLTIRSLSFRYHKLQRVVFKQNLRGLLLKRWRLTLNQLRPTVRKQSQQQVFSLPVLDQSLVATLRQHLQLPEPNQLPWHALPFAALLGPSLVIALLAMVASWWCYVAIPMDNFPLRLIAAIWLLLQLLLLVGWRRYRWAHDAHWLVVRQGIVGQREQWYPLHKLQQINVNQSPWQRLLGVVTLQVIGAAGSERVTIQPAVSAYQLQQRWLTDISSSQKSWM
ncbi:PH domain-containing protein [Pseudidiomarina mangrovi]|uniref:PH domain-containing protein n=1 Tax=Pseudidiomarina mangrovi TaxID=2487133 RepID=UPI000FCA1B18|nr:PH domain-containing protein [Pseudidiomarina mangrovi]